MRKALISQGFSVWHLNRPQHLAVPNHLDATLFFQKKDYFSRFSNKIFLFFKTDT